MKRFVRGWIGEPGDKGLLVVGRHRRRVDVGTDLVGGGDGHRLDVGVDDTLRPADHHAAASGPCMCVEPGAHCAGSQRLAVEVEAFFCFRLGRRQRREQAIAQHAEFEIVEQLVDLLAVPADEREIVGTGGQGDIAHQLGQFAVGQHRRQVGAQRVADFAAHLFDMVDEAGE